VKRATRGTCDSHVKKHMEGMQGSTFTIRNEQRIWFGCENIGINRQNNKELGWLASNVIPSMINQTRYIMNGFGTLKAPQQHIMEESGFTILNMLCSFIIWIYKYASILSLFFSSVIKVLRGLLSGIFSQYDFKKGDYFSILPKFYS